MPRPPAGVTLSVPDALLLAGAVVWAWVLRGSPEAAWSLPVVLGHFFLFCNVFRIRRRFELIWSGIFLAVMVGIWLATGSLDWILATAIQIPVTVALILLEMRGPNYHGIGCRRINRTGLGAYLARREQGSHRA